LHRSPSIFSPAANRRPASILLVVVRLRQTLAPEHRHAKPGPLLGLNDNVNALASAVLKPFRRTRRRSLDIEMDKLVRGFPPAHASGDTWNHAICGLVEQMCALDP